MHELPFEGYVIIGLAVVGAIALCIRLLNHRRNNTEDDDLGYLEKICEEYNE